MSVKRLNNLGNYSLGTFLAGFIKTPSNSYRKAKTCFKRDLLVLIFLLKNIHFELTFHFVCTSLVSMALPDGFFQLMFFFCDNWKVRDIM